MPSQTSSATCARYGSSRPQYCPRCGGDTDVQQTYCGWCGLKLRTDASADPNIAAKPTGERKHVTVLFADIVGSTALISHLDPEQSASILDPALRAMAGIVTARTGFVTRLTGDGIKAVFGIPATREDHADRACSAALAIRTMTQASRLRVRIGINSGEVVVRQLQSGTQRDYDAVGMAVHLAARLEQIAQPGTIHVSDATARLVAGRFHLRRAGRRTAKGVPGEIELFELLDSSDHSRWGGRARLGLSEFVGRTIELERLLATLTSSTPFISIVGEPGSGKSRLVFELLRRRELTRWTLMTVEADDDRAGLRPFARMLRGWLRVGHQTTPAQISAKLDVRLAELGLFTPSEAAALRNLLDLSDKATSADTRQSGILDALHRLIVRCAERGPILLVVEDAHWLDDDGLKLLCLLSAKARQKHLAIVQTFRPYGQPLPHNQPSIVLGPLSPIESRHLVDAIVGVNPALIEMKQRIVERAEGMPLFLEEMARLVLRSTEATEARSLIPDSIHAIIGERIDQLPSTSRKLLRIASTIGREVPLRLLCHVAGGCKAELEPILHLLEQRGFIRLEVARDDRQLVFSHVLTREVAYAGLLKTDRTPIHGAIVAAYEALYAPRLDEHVETLGAHATQAFVWEKAEFYLHRAAQKAIDRSNHTKAILFINEALYAIAQSSCDANAKAQMELDLRILLRVAFNAIGNYRERLANLDRAEALAKNLGQHGTLSSLWVSRASAILQLGQVDGAIHLCTRAQRVALRADDRETRLVAGYMLSRTYFYAGRLAASLATGERTLALLRAQPDSPRHGGGFGSSEVMLLTQLTQTRACLGKFADGLQSAGEALSLAEQTRRSFDIALASYGIGVAHFYAGDPTSAIIELEKGLHASQMDGAQSIYAPLGGLLGYAYFCAGRTEEAQALCQCVLTFDETSLYQANWPRLFGSMIMRKAGDHDAALRLAAASEATARKGGYPLQLVWSDLVLAQLYRETRPRAAARHLERALAQSRRMRMRPCQARALIETGNFRQEFGNENEARHYWRQGVKIARTIGMRVMGSAELPPISQNRSFEVW
jgi:class 3 adenylate cyclase/tetratricopeptide (TPR) repeat protein